jgi:Ca-activated chloride channel homolog
LYFVNRGIQLKTTVQILLLQLIASSLFAQQFYLRGEVKDEGGHALQNVTITHHATGYLYRTGSSGSFGIVTNKETDTLTFSFDGYQRERITVKAGHFITVKLKQLASTMSSVKRSKLASLTKDLSRDAQQKWYVGDETYASLVENNFVDASKYPTTGIALNIDRASYSNIRRFINLGMAIPPDAVRIEEMLNYFNFGYTEPKGDDIFHINTAVTSCPWAPDNNLLFVNVSSKKINVDSLPPSHLVFLIDISGSMDMPNRLPLLKSAFHLLARNLREKDTVSIVVYGGTVAIMLNPTSGKEKEKIAKAIDELTPGGSTPGESGVRMAYSIAKNHFIEGGNNRVILATDGDFNVGAKTEQELDDLISKHRQSGIYLTCLGVGMGNYKDSKIQTLARKGNGNFAYLDSYQEAEKILMKEFTQTLYTVADDVYMNIKFNPNIVKEYRLIGFDNKVGALADSMSIIEGGEIGSGHSMIAAFEIGPANNASTVQDFGEVSLQYRKVNDSTRKEMKIKFPYDPVPFKDAQPIYRFATSVIMFGSVLKSSNAAKDISWGDVIYQASESANPTDFNQHQFVELCIKAKALYSKFKKKKGRN